MHTTIHSHTHPRKDRPDRQRQMIIQIDDQYFNPLQIIFLTQYDSDIHVYFNDGAKLVFNNWKVYDLAARINQAISDF